jgi:hypothetical protein
MLSLICLTHGPDDENDIPRQQRVLPPPRGVSQRAP